MNQAQGNMDVWVDATHNDFAGRCGHVCSFCYVPQLKQPAVRAKYSGAPRLHEPALKQNLGRDKVIFMSDCTDLFMAGHALLGLRVEVIDHALRHPENWYHWRTKNSYNMRGLKFPPRSILGLSLETTESTSMWDSGISLAPIPEIRVKEFTELGYPDLPKMVALEPLFKLDIGKMVEWIVAINPDFVTVGIDSKDTPHPLGEPTAEEIEALVWKLTQLTDVILKPNLIRIMKPEGMLVLANRCYGCSSFALRTHGTYSQDLLGNRTLVGMCGYEYLDGLQEQRRQKNKKKP